MNEIPFDEVFYSLLKIAMFYIYDHDQSKREAKTLKLFHQKRSCTFCANSVVITFIDNECDKTEEKGGFKPT